MKTIAERFGIHTITQSNLARITPTIAAEMLRMNNINRNMRPSHIKYIERQINLGNWIVTHQGIAFSKSGLLIDGQHRLMAIVNSGKAVYMYVFEGLPDEAYKAIDIGHVARTQSDVTGISRDTVEIINAYNIYVMGASGGGGQRLSANETTQIYNDRKVHFDSILEYRIKEKHIGRAYIWAALVHYSEHNHKNAIEFAGAIVDPLTTIRPAQLFRSYLFRNADEGPRDKIGRLLYCMDAHNKGKDVSRIATKKISEVFV
jgi:hypothetical protein